MHTYTLHHLLIHILIYLHTGIETYATECWLAVKLLQANIDLNFPAVESVETVTETEMENEKGQKEEVGEGRGGEGGLESGGTIAADRKPTILEYKWGDDVQKLDEMLQHKHTADTDTDTNTSASGSISESQSQVSEGPYNVTYPGLIDVDIIIYSDLLYISFRDNIEDIFFQSMVDLVREYVNMCYV